MRQFEGLVKSGLPGMGYVRFDQSAQWPENLQVKANDPDQSLGAYRFIRGRELTEAGAGLYRLHAGKRGHASLRQGRRA